MPTIRVGGVQRGEEACREHDQNQAKQDPQRQSPKPRGRVPLRDDVECLADSGAAHPASMNNHPGRPPLRLGLIHNTLTLRVHREIVTIFPVYFGWQLVGDPPHTPPDHKN